MKPATFLSLIAVIAGGIVMLLLSRGTEIPLLQPAGPIAHAELRVIGVTFFMASLIVIPVFFLLFYFAWKYRARSPVAHVHHHPNWDHDNAAAEFIWWLGPSAIIGVLAIVAWQGSHALDPYVPLAGERTLHVQVVALNWKWLFLYPEQEIASVNELVIPTGTPVHFSLTGDAPMNSFWVPSLGGQVMVMPGMQTQLNLAADVPGTFRGVSGNISGEGFSGMTFKVRSVPQEQFDSWVERVRSSSTTPLTRAAYDALAMPSTGNPVTYFFPIDRDLYTSIYMKYMQGSDPMSMPTI